MRFRLSYSGWVILLGLLSTVCGCSFSSKVSRKMLERASKAPYDIVVVPGVPFENGTWSRTMKARVYWAKYLFDMGITKNVMFSGAAVYTPYYEGEIMAIYGAAIGIPKENIFTEIKAEHSTENIYYSFKKAKKLGFERIGLASDPFQTKMLAKFARKKVDAAIGLIPMVIDTLKMLEPQMKDPVIDPTSASVNTFVPLPKREGFWKRFRGTMGKNVDARAYE